MKSFVCEMGKGFSSVDYCRLLRRRDKTCKICTQFLKEFKRFKKKHKNQDIKPKRQLKRRKKVQVDYTKEIDKRFDEIFFGDEPESKRKLKRKLKRRTKVKRKLKRRV